MLPVHGHPEAVSAKSRLSTEFLIIIPSHLPLKLVRAILIAGFKRSKNVKAQIK